MTFDPNKPYAARHGRPVRILASDLKGAFPIVAAHTTEEGYEITLVHSGDGICGSKDHDIYNVPERVKVHACIATNDEGCLWLDQIYDVNVRFYFEGDKLVAVELIGDE